MIGNFNVRGDSSADLSDHRTDFLQRFSVNLQPSLSLTLYKIGLGVDGKLTFKGGGKIAAVGKAHGISNFGYCQIAGLQQLPGFFHPMVV